MIGGTRFRLTAAIARQGELSARIARGQADIASQRRLQVASDDPAAAGRIGQIDRARIDMAAWAAVVDQASRLSARADGALGGVQDNLDRARELITTALSSTTSATDRATAAEELRGLADDIDALATQSDATGQAIFPVSAPPLLPIGPNERLSPTPSRDDAFRVGVKTIGDVLRDAASALTSTNAAARDASLTEIAGASDAVAANRGLIGGRAARLKAIAQRLTDADASAAEELSALQDTDVAATIARIQGDQLALDASRSLFAQVNRRTLFDLLG